MKRLLSLCVAALITVPAIHAQEPAKPGPEHEMLKKLVGEWDATMKMHGQESKGSSTYKMELGGLWLFSNFEGDFGGMKFQGHGMDTYDARKKKYVSIWIDSFSTSPMVMEGDFNADTKTLTMVGDGPGMDGKPVRHKTVCEWKDDDNFVFTMYMGEGADPAFTIDYKRKK